MSYHQWSSPRSAGQHAYQEQSNKANMPDFNQVNCENQQVSNNIQHEMPPQQNFLPSDTQLPIPENHGSSNEFSNNGFQEAQPDGAGNGSANRAINETCANTSPTPSEPAPNRYRFSPYKHGFTTQRIAQLRALRGNFHRRNSRTFTRSNYNDPNNYMPEVYYNRGGAGNGFDNSMVEPSYSGVGGEVNVGENHAADDGSHGDHPLVQPVMGGYIAPNARYMGVTRYRRPMNVIPCHVYQNNTNFCISQQQLTPPPPQEQPSIRTLHIDDGSGDAGGVQFHNRLDDFPSLLSTVRRRSSGSKLNTGNVKQPAMANIQAEQHQAQEVLLKQQECHDNILEKNQQLNFDEKLRQHTQNQDQEKQYQQQQQQQQQHEIQFYQQKQFQTQAPQQPYLQHMQQQPGYHFQEYPHLQGQLQQKFQTEPNENNQMFYAVNEQQKEYLENQTKQFQVQRLPNQQFSQEQHKEFQMRQQCQQQQLGQQHLQQQQQHGQQFQQQQQEQQEQHEQQFQQQQQQLELQYQLHQQRQQYQQQRTHHQFQHSENQQYRRFPAQNSQRQQRQGGQYGNSYTYNSTGQYSTPKPHNFQWHMRNQQRYSARRSGNQHPMFKKYNAYDAQRGDESIWNQNQVQLMRSKGAASQSEDISNTENSNSAKYKDSQSQTYLLNFQIKTYVKMCNKSQQTDDIPFQQGDSKYNGSVSYYGRQHQNTLEDYLNSHLNQKCFKSKSKSQQARQKKTSPENYPTSSKRSHFPTYRQQQQALYEKDQNKIRGSSSSIVISPDNQEPPNEDQIVTIPPSTFKMRSEDFPELPSKTKSIASDSSSYSTKGSDTSQTTVKTVIAASKTTKDHAPVNEKEISNIMVSFEKRRKKQEIKEAAEHKDKICKPPKTTLKVSPSGVVTNIPPNMLTDQYGIAGLYSAVKGAETDPLIAQMVYGTDIRKLGLNMRSKHPLLPVFEGPFDGERPEPKTDELIRFPPQNRPKEETQANTKNDNCEQYLETHKLSPDVKAKLAPPTMKILSDNDLFYIFYFYVKDLLQLRAANELYNRSWVYYIKDNIWITRDHARTYQDNGQYEHGYYIVYDPNESKCVLKFLKIDKTQIDGRPIIPPIHRNNFNSL